MTENRFSCFYDTEVVIERAVNAGSYSGDTEYETVCTVKADVQPYGNGGKQREHGIFKNICFVMYCADNELICTGMRAVVNGVRLTVAGAERRGLGMKVYLKEGV